MPTTLQYVHVQFRQHFCNVVCTRGSVIDDDNGRIEADDGNDDDDDEPAIELQQRTDVTVVSRLIPVGCNRAKTVPVVRLDTACTAHVGSA